MQTLWNRIAQIKRARKFSSAFSSTAACARRTATTAFRSRLNSRHRLTIFYSSFLTAATLVDSEIKGSKREKLLRAIQEAKDELKALDTSQNRRLAALSPDYDDIKEAALNGERTWEDILKWAEEENRARESLGFKGWKGIPLRILERLSTSELEDAFRNNSMLRKLLLGTDSRPYSLPVRSIKKQKILEWSTAKLAHTFLREIDQQKASLGQRSSALGEFPSILEEMKRSLMGETGEPDDRIAQIRSIAPFSEEAKEYPSPKAPRYFRDPSFNGKEVSLLNSALEDIFQLHHTQGQGLQYLFISICQRLFFSAAPPNIQTYTLLARHFQGLGMHRLVKAVWSAIQECRLRLDEEALSFWLDYYAAENNLEEFQKLLSRMDNFGDDLCPAYVNNIVPGIAFDQYQIGRRFDEPPDFTKCRDSTISNSEFFSLKYRDWGQMVLRVARQNPTVYESVIRGTLKLIGDDKAMGIYIDMIRDGHEPTAETLSSILHQCCYQKDWKSALRVLQKFHAYKGANLHTYRWLLRICQNCQHSRRFKKALEGGIRLGIISPAAQYFPKEIEAMQADRLLDLAMKFDEPVKQAEDASNNFEPAEKLARWLLRLANDMAKLAFDCGSLTVKTGHNPAKSYFLHTRMMYRRADVLRWIEGRADASSKFAQDVLDTLPGSPNTREEASNGEVQRPHGLEVSDISYANSISTKHPPVRSRRKYTSLWEPVLRILINEFLKMRRLLHKLVRELNAIEVSLQHRSTTKMVLVFKSPRKSQSQLRKPSPRHKINEKSEGITHARMQDLANDVSRPKEQGKVRRPKEWDLNMKLEAPWEALDLGRTPLCQEELL